MTLLEVQTRMARTIFAPLTSADRIVAGVDAGYIKPNGRLAPAGRLEIYSRSYWYRILDSLYDDFPGLRAVLGQRAFRRLSRAYLADCPSRSFTLRNLGSRLVEWLERNPHYAAKRPVLALDMARLEWAHIEAFDNAVERALEPEDLLESGAELSLSLQPHVRLLSLQYPVDDLRIRVNHASDERGAAIWRAGRSKPQRIFIAVHRVECVVHYRRIAAEEYFLLSALRKGWPFGKAISAAFENASAPPEEQGPMLEKWFATWAQLGWLCPIRSKKRG
jgi:hypothetical protein